MVCSSFWGAIRTRKKTGIPVKGGFYEPTYIETKNNAMVSSIILLDVCNKLVLIITAAFIAAFFYSIFN